MRGGVTTQISVQKRGVFIVMYMNINTMTLIKYETVFSYIPKKNGSQLHKWIVRGGVVKQANDKKRGFCFCKVLNINILTIFPLQYRFLHMLINYICYFKVFFIKP